MFEIKAHLTNGGLKLPCKGDQWIMVKNVEVGFGKDELERLSKVGIHQTGAVLVLCTRCFREVFGREVYEENKTG